MECVCESCSLLVHIAKWTVFVFLAIILVTILVFMIKAIFFD